MNSISSFLTQLSSFDNAWEGVWFLIKNGGWVLLLIVLLWGLKEAWLYWRQNIYYSKQKYVLLAVDVPKENEQGPKAVENLFAQIYGSYKTPNLVEKYWQGFLTPKFSFEIISDGGYLQFLVHSPTLFRNLVEAAIYAQYPDAEITEVEDYAGAVPTAYPNKTYNLWGTEFVTYNKDHYPIRTYPFFEYGLTQEFKDPMASLLEIMSNISPTEHIWLQLVITPILPDWIKGGVRLVRKLIGAQVPETDGASTYFAKLGQAGQKLAKGAFDTATASFKTSETEVARKQQALRSQMLYLSPGERTAVEAVEAKISKHGFDTKFRFMYWGPRDIFSKPRGVNGILGSIAQFNSLDLNGFKPHPKSKTTIDYFFIKRRVAARQRRLVLAYKYRSNWRGRARFVLNIEELATLWHFPMMDIRTPLLKKTEAKRMEPPFALPVEQAPRQETEAIEGERGEEVSEAEVEEF
ncbi:hypothetical protein KKD19_06220 [Patescibacteria group bacterium]|nr:hypothetical protein [Patescibacteria group bacterium]MBU4512800.1 hypothetical protein [Patescibacteria group bacterium]